MFPYWSCFRSYAQRTQSDRNAKFLPDSLQNQPDSPGLLWDLEPKAESHWVTHTSSDPQWVNCPLPQSVPREPVYRFNSRSLLEGFSLPSLLRHWLWHYHSCVYHHYSPFHTAGQDPSKTCRYFLLVLKLFEARNCSAPALRKGLLLKMLNERMTHRLVSFHSRN